MIEGGGKKRGVINISDLRLSIDGAVTDEESAVDDIAQTEPRKGLHPQCRRFVRHCARVEFVDRYENDLFFTKKKAFPGPADVACAVRGRKECVPRRRGMQAWDSAFRLKSAGDTSVEEAVDGRPPSRLWWRSSSRH